MHGNSLHFAPWGITEYDLHSSLGRAAALEIPVKLPHFVQIEPVGQCNLRCQMCPVRLRRDGPPHGTALMNFDVFCRLIDQFHQAAQLHLQGLGEPLMHPRLFDMVAYAVAKGIRVSCTSNMTLLSPRRASLCVTSGLAALNISVDSADPETYERIRVGATFGRVEQNVELLQATKSRLQAATPRLRLVGVLMRQTLEGLPDLVRLTHRWGIGELFIQHLCHDFAENSLPAEYLPMRRFVDHQTLVGRDWNHIQRVFVEARAVAADLDIVLRLPSPRPHPHPPGTPGPRRCDWPWARGYVSYQGLSMPCCMIGTPDRFNFGNMADQGVDAIWNSERYESFRNQLSSDDPPDICRTCSVYHQTF